jgi:hypothetical protein
MTERHFTLGDDWSDFSSLIDDQLVKAAKQGLLKLPGNKLQGRTFLTSAAGAGRAGGRIAQRPA